MMCKASSLCELAKIKYLNGQRDNFFTLAPDSLLETQAQRELHDTGK